MHMHLQICRRTCLFTSTDAHMQVHACTCIYAHAPAVDLEAVDQAVWPRDILRIGLHNQSMYVIHGAYAPLNVEE